MPVRAPRLDRSTSLAESLAQRLQRYRGEAGIREFEFREAEATAAEDRQLAARELAELENMLDDLYRLIEPRCAGGSALIPPALKRLQHALGELDCKSRPAMLALTRDADVSRQSAHPARMKLQATAAACISLAADLHYGQAQKWRREVARIVSNAGYRDKPVSPDTIRAWRCDCEAGRHPLASEYEATLDRFRTYRFKMAEALGELEQFAAHDLAAAGVRNLPG